MAEVLAHGFRQPFVLHITTTQSAAEIQRPETGYLEAFEVREVENRGRDILPFLSNLNDCTHPFEIGLKLHAKKSPHRADGRAWGMAMVRALAGEASRTDDIARAMRSNPHIGLVAPDGLLLPLVYRLGANAKLMQKIAAALEFDLSKSSIRGGWMAAGSMFWFRRDAIDGLLTTKTHNLFDAESGQLDGTTAHAFERLFALTAVRRGFIVLPADRLTACGDMVDQAAVDVELNRHADESIYAVNLRRVPATLLHWFPGLMPLFLRLPEPLRRLIRSVLRSR